MLTLAHNAGLIVITLNVIPRLNTSFSDATRLTFNSLIDADHDWVDEYIDICAEPEFDANADRLNTTYYNADEIHLTTAGYTLIANLLAPTIQSVANS
jgi:lysophospholipase L1-like esterase